MRILNIILTPLIISLVFYSCSAKRIHNDIDIKKINVDEIGVISAKISFKKNDKLISGYFKLIKLNSSYKIILGKNYLFPENSSIIPENKLLDLNELISTMSNDFNLPLKLKINTKELIAILLGNTHDKGFGSMKLQIKHNYQGSKNKIYPRNTIISRNNEEIKIAIDSITII
tara:strand:+ start:1358 stop:1876 length:519 start_codon:yes stop_codon:yes gene_type:complete